MSKREEITMLQQEIDVNAMREVLRKFSSLTPAAQEEVVLGTAQYTTSVLGYVRMYHEDGGR